MKATLDEFMLMAVEEAKESLREGKCGFGAVIVRDQEIIARAHDTEKTRQDPTAHAELTAIRMAAAKHGCNLDGCTMISTHEPCPMCATAIVWSGIDTVVFGFSIQEALQQGRRRINLPCREIFERAGKSVTISPGVLHSQCALLYNQQVRDCIAQLRGADDQRIDSLAQQLLEKRLSWFERRRDSLERPGATPLDRAYQVLLAKLAISAGDAPIVERSANRIIIHSRNFCPTLEACRILKLDTRYICGKLTEKPMDELLKRVDPRLRFSRNYSAIRPHCEYCEETISLAE